MTETLAPPETEQTPMVLLRTFAAEIEPAGGRTVDVRIVPYGQTARVSDGGPAYDEQWMPGVFSHQVNAANRVLVNFEHQPGIGGVVGHGLELRDAPDGFHGSFRLHASPDGDKTLLLVREGILDGVSLEALPVRTVRTAAGVSQRVKANLRAVALCRNPAFADAKVLAVREQAFVVDEDMCPVDIDPGLVERVRRLGLNVPKRYEAHPAPDTPPSGGTSVDGTRQTIGTPDTEESWEQPRARSV